MEVLDVEQQEDEQYEALLKSSTHANIKKNIHFFTHQRYQGTNDPANLPQASEENDEEGSGQA